MSIVRIDNPAAHTHGCGRRSVPAEVEAVLRQFMAYDPLTGLLTWRVKRPRATAAAGDQIGCINSWGYLRFAIQRREFMVHRVCWFLHYGEWPTQQIDHINGIKTDNRIANLRDVPQNVNMQNLLPKRSKTTSGLLGAHVSGSTAKKPWSSSIKVDGRSYYLGDFDTPLEAHQAYMAAKATMHTAASGRRLRAEQDEPRLKRRAVKLRRVASGR